MKLNEYKLEGWNNNEIKTTISFDNYKVLLLKIDLLDNPPVQGRTNLLAVNNTNDIIWIADIPKKQVLYGFYSVIKKDPNSIEKIFAWCGSVYCEIDATKGKILYEQETR